MLIDIILLALFFGIIIFKTYKVIKEKRQGDLGSETNLKESGTSRRGGEHDPQHTPGFCLASHRPPVTP